MSGMRNSSEQITLNDSKGIFGYQGKGFFPTDNFGSGLNSLRKYRTTIRDRMGVGCNDIHKILPQ